MRGRGRREGVAVDVDVDVHVDVEGAGDGRCVGWMKPPGSLAVMLPVYSGCRWFVVVVVVVLY